MPSKLQEKPSALKREHPSFKTLNFLSFLYFRGSGSSRPKSIPRYPDHRVPVRYLWRDGKPCSKFGTWHFTQLYSTVQLLDITTLFSPFTRVFFQAMQNKVELVSDYRKWNAGVDLVFPLVLWIRIRLSPWCGSGCESAFDYHSDADPDSVLFDADPEQTFHHETDPDPSFKIIAQTLKKVLQ